MEWEEQTKKVGRPPVPITPKSAEWAVLNAQSNYEASRLLRVHYDTWRKYAKEIIDPSSPPDAPQTCWESLKKKKKRHWRKRGYGFKSHKIEDILEGKSTYHYPNHLITKLIKEGVLERKCYYCNITEKRITDGKMPLLLIFQDGDKNNLKPGNLEMLCYNCYFFYIGEFNNVSKLHFKGY